MPLRRYGTIEHIQPDPTLHEHAHEHRADRFECVFELAWATFTTVRDWDESFLGSRWCTATRVQMQSGRTRGVRPPGRRGETPTALVLLAVPARAAPSPSRRSHAARARRRPFSRLLACMSTGPRVPAGRGRLDFAAYLVARRRCCPRRGQRGKRAFRGHTPLHW